MAVYGYARCSTNESKQDIDRQKRDLKEQGAKIIFYEYESGTKADRPEFEKLLQKLEPGDTIVATEVSRLARSTIQVCELLEFAVTNQLKLKIGSLSVDCKDGLDAMTGAMLKMMGVFSELERNIVIDRINSGIRNARQKGVRIGRPPKTKADIPILFFDNLSSYLNGELNKTEFAKLCGISRPTLNKYLAIVK